MFKKKKDEDRPAQCLRSESAQPCVASHCRKPIEQEIAELQRKFRVLAPRLRKQIVNIKVNMKNALGKENDKRACSEDSQGRHPHHTPLVWMHCQICRGTIRKQRATIEKLTRENRKMKAKLSMLSSRHQCDCRRCRVESCACGGRAE